MKKKFILFLLINLITCGIVHSQGFQWVKANTAGYYSSPNEGDRIIQTDSAKSVYILGNFYGIVDFDPGPNVVNLTATNNDGYLLKLDSVGNFVWVKKFTTTGLFKARALCVDQDTNIYIAGLTNGTTDMDPGLATSNVVSSNDYFVVKLNPSGNYILHIHFGNIQNNYLGDLKVDNANNIILVGWFANIIDFDPGPGVYLDTASNSTWQGFCLKLDAMGNFLWCNTIGETGVGVDIDAVGNIYCTGSFSGIWDFDPGPNVYNLVESGSFHDVYIVKFNSNGSFGWAKSLKGNGTSDAASDIQFKNNFVYTTGTYQSTPNAPVDFNVDAGTYYMHTNGGTSAFVLKLTAAGNYVWAKQLYSNNNIRLHTINVDAVGNIYGCGEFSDSLIYNYNTTNAIWNLSTPFSQSLYIFKMSDSVFDWFNVYNMPSSSFSGSRLCIDTAGGIYTTGYASGNQLDYNLGTGSDIIYFSNTYTFVLKLAKCQNFATSLTVSTCDSFSLGGQTWYNSGNYAALLQTINGCDSLVNIQLTIANISTSAQINGITLNCNVPNATYQWIDCATNQPIAGATSQTYTPNSSGIFAVVVGLNNCSDTSNCIPFIPVGTSSPLMNNYIYLLANPVHDKIIVRQDAGVMTNATIYIFNVSGIELIKTPLSFTKGVTVVDCQKLAPGVYFYKIFEGNISVKQGKFIKLE